MERQEWVYPTVTDRGAVVGAQTGSKVTTNPSDGQSTYSS
jgi:hypothetical protein